MKNKITLFVTCMCFLFFATKSMAQEKANTSITAVKKTDQTVEVTVTSSKPFYMGNNIHILHIGNKEFTHSKQTKDNEKGILTFFIPVADYNSIAVGTDVWMSYGNLFKVNPDQTQDIKTMCEKSPQKCWYLGKFSN
jgi:hypothetical protein